MSTYPREPVVQKQRRRRLRRSSAFSSACPAERERPQFPLRIICNIFKRQQTMRHKYNVVPILGIKKIIQRTP